MIIYESHMHLLSDCNILLGRFGVDSNLTVHQSGSVFVDARSTYATGGPEPALRELKVGSTAIVLRILRGGLLDVLIYT